MASKNYPFGEFKYVEGGPDGRLGEAAGVPEFDYVLDRLVELVNFAVNEQHPLDGPWDSSHSYSIGWDDPVDYPKNQSPKIRYLLRVLDAFCAGQRKVGISYEAHDSRPDGFVWRGQWVSPETADKEDTEGDMTAYEEHMSAENRADQVRAEREWAEAVQRFKNNRRRFGADFGEDTLRQAEDVRITSDPF